MPSTFTVNKLIEKPASGSYNNAWAQPVNQNWDELDASLGGHSVIIVTGVIAGTYALTIDQYRPPNIEILGPLGANLTYALPAGVGGIWSVWNNTTGGHTINFAVTGGGSFLLPQGQRSLLVCDGVNIAAAQSVGANTANPTAVVGLTTVNGVASTLMRSDAAPPLDQSIAPTWTGIHRFNAGVSFAQAVSILATETLGASGEIDARPGTILVPTMAPGDNTTNAASTQFVHTSFAPLASPALTGTPTVPTAAPGTNTTQASNTAFVQAAIAALNVRHGTTTNGSINVGSLLINYGQHTTSGSSPDTITYTTAFTTAVFAVVPYLIDANMELFVSSGFTTSLSNFTVNFGATSQLMGWIAIGV